MNEKSYHHTIPASKRKGRPKGGRLKATTPTKHWAWHTLFDDMTPQEAAKEIVSVYLEISLCWSEYARTDRLEAAAFSKKQAWEVLFAGMDFNQAQTEILQNWA